ncbi:hypothetical protein PV10_01400 [Exophiala mesophila]|uniref:Cell wall proline rich protein n=1 Tax=Exophiala mesophila TaxID=212818 RepID=A0A0D1YAM0_EXOME|nr:uncharacterized protein PV10_01400 [Exophiala mesophila]KIV97686.1 hypothetical protein PV10_01400 [Exophiala mesophila]
MASISLPTPPSLLSPLDPDLQTPPRSPQPHRRRPSRSPNVPATLPPFLFNPALEGAPSLEAANTDKASPEVSPMALDSSRRSARPLPLPEFKFNPGADLPLERSPSPTHPILQEMALNQQRAVRSARPAPLPAFTFAPSPSIAQTSPSPTKTDFSESQPPPRTHRRGISEFVGGGGLEGPHMVSSSPEKLEHRPHAPVTGGRGHAHRRSQAVSISDIDTSELIKVNALAKARAGSTPTTPSDPSAFAYGRGSPQIRQSMSNVVRTPPSSPRRRGSAPGVRPRVGFSEHVDVIPRPLSMISSETEGSSSTIRGGHSLSGSINSIASPAARPTFIVTSSNDSTSSSPERPHTADALSTLSLGLAARNSPVSMINLPKRPLSASGSPSQLSSGSPPSKKKHFWSSHSEMDSPLNTPKVEQSDPMDVFSASPTPQPPRLHIFGDNGRPKTSSGEMSSSSKRRKYHTWTSGIFSRKDKRASKPKPDVQQKRASLTRRPSDRLNEIFDADDTIVLREPSPVANRTRPFPQDLDTSQACIPGPASDMITSPVLDLDAALGPFGSEEKLGYDVGGKVVHVNRISKLHSSERRANVDAFGTVHRRTESAPTMPALNRSIFDLHRMGSNSSLSEDVFDEEEEDKLLAQENANSKLERIQSRTRRSITPQTFSASPLETADLDATGGLGLTISNKSPVDGITIADTDDDVAKVDRSSNSTIAAPILSDDVKRPMSSPMPFPYPAPQSHYASSTEGRTTSASMMSSPDVDHTSFENSSRPSKSQGEFSPDFVLRASNDDLPSLSDSISSGALPRVSSSACTRSSVEQRSQSMIVPSTSRSNIQADWKRSSLASLNRLIPGSANGSKLKFETVPDPVDLDEKGKKKPNRISRLMHFWKSKDRDAKQCNSTSGL